MWRTYNLEMNPASFEHCKRLGDFSAALVVTLMTVFTQEYCSDPDCHTEFLQPEMCVNWGNLFNKEKKLEMEKSG